MSAQPPARSQSESPEERAHSTHQEARMVLAGIQALFGFQLIAAVNARSMELSAVDRGFTSSPSRSPRWRSPSS